MQPPELGVYIPHELVRHQRCPGVGPYRDAHETAPSQPSCASTVALRAPVAVRRPLQPSSPMPLLYSAETHEGEDISNLFNERAAPIKLLCRIRLRLEPYGDVEAPSTCDFCQDPESNRLRSALKLTFACTLPQVSTDAGRQMLWRDIDGPDVPPAGACIRIALPALHGQRQQQSTFGNLNSTQYARRSLALNRPTSTTARLRRGQARSGESSGWVWPGVRG